MYDELPVVIPPWRPLTTIEETRAMYREVLRADLLRCPELAAPDLGGTIDDIATRGVELSELSINIRNAVCEDGDYDRHMTITGEFAKRLESLGADNIVNTFVAGILADAVAVSADVLALATAAGTA